ncbi:MAG TPA: hypothetical protein VGJ82_00110 [Thermoanaerobaculia bacterium]|jgi:hypothetical protein
MDDTTRNRIRHIFLSPRPHFALIRAAELLGMTFSELKREIKVGAIVAVRTSLGMRVAREEMVAAALRLWEQAVVEEALGAEAAAVLPEAIRLVELRARIPRYQRDMLHYLAARDATTVDHVLARELEDVACEYSEELAESVPGFAATLAF